MRHYLIVGAGAAGVAACETIRQSDPHGEILLISEEAEGYYSRPALAYVLSREIQEKMIFPFSDADFKRLNIKRMHASAHKIHPETRELELNDGSRLVYDRLLIATGAQAIRPKLANIDLDGVVKLDNIADARQILHLARKARSAVVVGGGITALEIVEGLCARGLHPHYFLRGERYWNGVLDEHESQIVLQRLQAEGVHLHFNTELAEIVAKNNRVAAVITQDGRQIACDLLAAAIGIQPRLELARASGLRVERGVWVNETLQTDHPGVFAAGDVAETFDPLTGKTQLNSLWPLARDQGRVAGMNMTVDDQRPELLTAYHKSVPFNVTRLAGLTTSIIGTVGKGAEQDIIGIVRGDSETWRELPDAIAAQGGFDVNSLRVLVGEDKLLGALVMGDQTLSRPLQQMISRQVDIRTIRQQILQPDAAVADILADFWAKDCQR